MVKKTYALYTPFLILEIILALSVGLIMIGFNGWNWYLVLTGNTAIDFWMKKGNKKKVNNQELPEEKVGWIENMYDNVYKTFGTKSLFMMVMPSLRPLPFRGLEWSFERLDSDPESQIEVNQQERTKEISKNAYDLINKTDETDSV